MNKKNKTIVLALAIIIIIIVSSTFIYIQYTKEEKHPEQPEDITTIDDRISPLVNQGLILEIQRIRNRGLLDKIIKIGNSWKQKPSFYFISNIDGLEYVSKDVEAAGAESEILFNTWDTILQENKILIDTPEGQEKSSVTLTLVERVPSGLLGRKSQDIVRDEIKVTYDYRTGRWTGDDSFMDDDGYGHYRGETFDVWFHLYQTDSDSDGIPYWTEVNVLGTDPRVDDSKLDPDNDGIPTDWEWEWGYDPNTWDDHYTLDPDVDGVENIEEYQMRKYFADPFQRDMYIEVDGMEQNGLFDPAHVFYEESAQILIERFAQHNINIYIDNGWPDGPINGGGELLPHVETISQDSGMMLQFYRHHFADERKGIFRYMIVGHNTGFCHPSVSNKYDTLAIDSSLNKLIKRKAFTARTQRIVLTGAAMHELGHSQGLGSWTFAGIDNRTIYSDKKEFVKIWAGYESVMNYYYIFDKRLLDYSNGDDGAPYDQDDWSILYLPTFEIDAEVIEGPNYAFLDSFEEKVAAIVDKVSEPSHAGWKYDENLTNTLASSISDEKIIYKGDCEYLVLIKVDKNSNIISGDRNMRVYMKPKILPVYSAWSLSCEGTFDPADDSFEFYSSQEIVDILMNSIK
jgi:hypothetical protein